MHWLPFAADAITYPGFKVIAESLNLELAPIPTTLTGPDLTALESLCQRRPVRAIYTMPTLHNPLGWVMDERARQRLTAVARRHRLLIVEDDDNQRKALVELIGNGDVVTTAVGSAEESLNLLRTQHFDCMVLDLGLPDMTGFDLINMIKSDEKLRELPIIVYTGKELSQEEETRLKRVTDAIIVKSVRSMEHLLDETALFLHRVEANLPQSKQQMLKQVHHADPVFSGKKVLIVDDDVRNIFAITSVLERYKMVVIYAENGRRGIEVLHQNPDVNVVLMDVMMPEDRKSVV